MLMDLTAKLGYAHRDLKPDNILLANPINTDGWQSSMIKNANIKLCDYGYSTYTNIE